MGDAVVTERRTRTGRRRILVVDDQAISRDIARSVLEAAGEEVDVAAAGAAAVAAARARRYDLILMDLNMPAMDGYAASEAIRRLGSDDARPTIVALTGTGGAGEPERRRRAGIADLLTKPFAPGDLVAAVDRWTAAPRRRRPARAEIWDREAFDMLAIRLGAGRVSEALLMFRTKLAGAAHEFGGDSPDRDRLDREAHDLVSVAGMFGFARLSAVSRDVMTADRNAPSADLARTLRRAVAEALERLDRGQAAFA